MIRIAIVEDEERNRVLLTEHLRRYEQQHGLRFDITTFTDGREIIAKYRPDFDIVLLDIQMEHVDGMTAAKRIREVDQEVVLVFITNSPQYAIGGYQVAAMSYLLKPLPYPALAAELDRCLAQVAKRDRGSLLITAGTEQHRIAIADIVYIESVKHRLIIHATDREYSLVGTLSSMEEQLEGKDFFRCNNPYLVNLQHVTAVQQASCLMRGGVELQVSRPRKKAFLAALSDYVGGSRA